MNMQVIESGNKDLVAKIHHLTPPIHIFRQLAIDTFYHAVRLDHDIAVLNDFEFSRCRSINDIRAIDFHDLFLSLKKSLQMR